MPRKKKSQVETRLIPIRLSEQHIELLDRLCKRELDPTNRTDMIRRLIDRAATRLPAAPAVPEPVLPRNYRPVDPFAVTS